MSSKNYGFGCDRSQCRSGLPFQHAFVSLVGKAALVLIFLLGVWACGADGQSAGGSAQEGETDIVLGLQDPKGQSVEKAVVYRYARSWSGEQLIDSLTCHKVCSLSYHSQYSYRLRDSLGRQRAYYSLDSGLRITSILAPVRNLLVVDSAHLARPLIYGGIGLADSVAGGWKFGNVPVGQLGVAWKKAWLMRLSVDTGSSALVLGPVRLLDSIGVDQSLGTPAKAVNLAANPSQGLTVNVPVVVENPTQSGKLSCALQLEIWADSYHFGGDGAFGSTLQRVQSLLQSKRSDCQWSIAVVADSLLYGSISVQNLAAQALAKTAPAPVNVRAMVITADSIPKVLPQSAGGLPVLWIGLPEMSSPSDPVFDSLWVNRILQYFPK